MDMALTARANVDSIIPRGLASARPQWQGVRPQRAAHDAAPVRAVVIDECALLRLGLSRMLEAINFEAARHGYSIELISVNDPSTGEITQALGRLDREAVDGIIVRLDAHRMREHTIRFPTRVPTVLVEGESYDDRVSVDADHRHGTELAVRHLLELGHPTVWHLAGPADNASAATREQAWRDTLEVAGIAAPKVLRIKRRLSTRFHDAFRDGDYAEAFSAVEGEDFSVLVPDLAAAVDLILGG